MPRVALNALAPDFSLPDHTGKNFILSEMTKSANVLLVFNRGFV